MNEQPSSSEDLIHEIVRYLAAVDLFRAEQCEPTWRRELVSIAVEERAATAVVRVPSTH